MVTEDADRIPTATFDSDTLPPDQRIEAFAQLTLGYQPILPPGITADRFRAQCRAWLLDDLVITANEATAIELHRTPAHIKAYSRDTYTLIVLKEGSWWADLDYGSIQVGSGQICIMDFTVPWVVRGAPQSNVMMVVPRATMEELAPEAPRLHGRVLEGASGRLCAEHMISLARHLPELQQRDVPLVRDATLRLIGSALGSLVPREPPARRHVQRALAVGRVRSYIDERLADPALTPAAICDALAVTRPTLYRAFEAEGGVASYIQRRRLEAAHARLSGGGERSSLAEIADEFCFSSPAHFSTAFRRQFGFTPREARSTARPVPARSLFQSWQEVLREP